jgi:hypothetical protein
VCGIRNAADNNDDQCCSGCLIKEAKAKARLRYKQDMLNLRANMTALSRAQAELKVKVSICKGKAKLERLRENIAYLAGQAGLTPKFEKVDGMDTDK